MYTLIGTAKLNDIVPQTWQAERQKKAAWPRYSPEGNDFANELVAA